MDTEALKIPKKKKLVALWVQAEGQVIASVFLQFQSDAHSGEETPEDVFNRPDTFIVVMIEDPQETRFYHMGRITRVEYHEDIPPEASSELSELPCRLTLLDGSQVEGTIRSRNQVEAGSERRAAPRSPAADAALQVVRQRDRCPRDPVGQAGSRGVTGEHAGYDGECQSSHADLHVECRSKQGDPLRPRSPRTPLVIIDT